MVIKLAILISNNMELTSEQLKKAQSPFSIYHYIKKYNCDNNEATRMRDEFILEVSQKRKTPTQIEYWIRKGYSELEAKEQVCIHNINAASRPRKNPPFISEIRNLMKSQNITEYEATQIASEKRRKYSPRCVEYWLKRGYSEQESHNNVKLWQQQVSPRCVSYWIQHGYSEEEAVKKVSHFQNNYTMEKLMVKFNCNDAEVFDLLMDHFENVNWWENSLYLAYRNEVYRLSNITYTLYRDEIDPNNLRSREYHLDHKYSIKDSFIAGLNPKISACKFNLTIINASDNCNKNTKSTITLKELINLYENTI